jgi:hypothetical protein
MEVTPEVVGTGLVVLVLAAYFIARRRVPKEKSFRCARCSAAAPHTARTIAAWRAGKTKLFCSTCHTSWLNSQPVQGARARANRERVGCLGVVACFALLPALMLLAVWLSRA